MLANRCFRVRGTHDLETRQDSFGGFGSSRRGSTMWSRIPGGRCGFDMVVGKASGPVLTPCFLPDFIVVD